MQLDDSWSLVSAACCLMVLVFAAMHLVYIQHPTFLCVWPQKGKEGRHQHALNLFGSFNKRSTKGMKSVKICFMFEYVLYILFGLILIQVHNTQEIKRTLFN